MKHFVVIVGARPNFIKAAALLHEAKNHKDYRFTVVHTGQHYDYEMSEIFFKELGIKKPSVFLNVTEGTPHDKMKQMIVGIRKVLSERKYNGIIIFGDVNSTLAGALASDETPLIHIEAGLRSFDERMPEEMNRFIVDHLSSLLFTTEKSGKDNLIDEGISQKRIKFVGNLMIETLELFFKKIVYFEKKQKLHIVATIHRAENINSVKNLRKIVSLLRKLSKKYTVFMPLHPGTQKKIKAYGFDMGNIVILKPLGYIEFMRLVFSSLGVVTDSGGIQEETTHLGVPCVTLRDNTERPVTIEKGSNKLFSVDAHTKDVLKHLKKTSFKARQIPRWDSGVSKRIFRELDKFCGDA